MEAPRGPFRHPYGVHGWGYILSPGSAALHPGLHSVVNCSACKTTLPAPPGRPRCQRSGKPHCPLRL